MPEDSTKLQEAFLHASNKGLTVAGQKAFNTTYDSTGIDASITEALREVLPFVHSKAELDTWIGANPGVLKKYNKVQLTEIPGSNGQSWILQDGGTQVINFIVENLLTSRTDFTVPNAYVLELYRASAGARILPNDGDWWFRPDQGILRFEVGKTPVDMGWGIPEIVIYVLDPEFLASLGGGAGGGGVTSEPVYIGTKDVDDTWMLLRDKGTNFVDNGVTGLAPVDDNKLHFFRREAGVYISKSQMGNSIHSDRFLANTTAGGFYLPNGEDYSQVMRVANRGEHGAVFGNYFGATFLVSDGPDSLNHAYTVGSDITFSTLDPDPQNWIYIQTDVLVVEFPPAEDPYALSEFSAWTDTAGVAMRIIIEYIDTGQLLYESQTDYAFRTAPDQLTSVGQTKIKLKNPVPVDKNRPIRYTIRSASVVGIRKHAYVPWVHVLAKVKKIEVGALATKPEVGRVEWGLALNAHLSTLHDHDGMALADENGELLIFNVADTDHRVSDFAYSENLGIDTLHDEEGHALTDEDGELLIFDSRIALEDVFNWVGEASPGVPWTFETVYTISQDFPTLAHMLRANAFLPIPSGHTATLRVWETGVGKVLMERVANQVADGFFVLNDDFNQTMRIGADLTVDDLDRDILIKAANYTINLSILDHATGKTAVMERQQPRAESFWPAVSRSGNTHVLNRGIPNYWFKAPGVVDGSGYYNITTTLNTIDILDDVTEFQIAVVAPDEWQTPGAYHNSVNEFTIVMTDNNGQFYNAPVPIALSGRAVFRGKRYQNIWVVDLQISSGVYSAVPT